MTRRCWNWSGSFILGEEFLALLIEYVDGPKKPEAYFHGMNKVRMN